MNNNHVSIVKRSKSLSSLQDMELEARFEDYPRYSRLASECSTAAPGTESDDERHGFSDEDYRNLEYKIDRLSDLFLEQCRILAELKEEILNARSVAGRPSFLHNKVVAELLKKIVEEDEGSQSLETETEGSSTNSRARSLLAAIEAKRGICLDREIRDALVDFLNSEELSAQLVSATTQSLQALVREQFSRELTSVYLPLLQRSQRLLKRRVSRVLEEGFMELEANTASFSSSVYKISRALRHALERHHLLLEEVAPRLRPRYGQLKDIVEGVLEKELSQWRNEAVNVWLAPEPPLPSAEWIEEHALEYPDSPPQPSHPDQCITDQLMRTAEINKHIADGDVPGSFARALAAGDLSLVMAACRAVQPARVFNPCVLAQHVLLSLAQQLATDMVLETPLKCRYLEEAIVNLNPLHPATRTHLPLVVGEIRKHLNDFLTKYPSHVARCRIKLIIMAAENLLK